MDLNNRKYLHKYKILELGNSSSPTISSTDWKNVSEDYFRLHQNDFKMEILSRNSAGKYNNLVSPAGFTNIIGKDTYGSWNDSSNIWNFHPEYTQLEKELFIDGLPITRSEHAEFQEKYLYNKPYYGPPQAKKDSTKYGTRSRFYFFRYSGFYSRYHRTKKFNTKRSTGANSKTTRGGGGFGK